MCQTWSLVPTCNLLELFVGALAKPRHLSACADFSLPVPQMNCNILVHCCNAVFTSNLLTGLVKLPFQHFTWAAPAVLTFVCVKPWASVITCV